MTILAYGLALRALCRGRLALDSRGGYYTARYGAFVVSGDGLESALTNLLTVVAFCCRTENAA